MSSFSAENGHLSKKTYIYITKWIKTSNAYFLCLFFLKQKWNAVMKHMLTIYTFALFPVSTTVRNLSSSIVERFIGTNSRKKFIVWYLLLHVKVHLSWTQLGLADPFFKKPKLFFSLRHAHRNSSCSNDIFSVTFGWSCSNLSKGPPYLIWQYWLGVLGVYLSVTSQLTVESRIDRAQNA